MSSPTTSEDLAFDELPVAGSSLDVQIARGANLGAAAAREPRPPHRHAYHELLWVRCGTGTHEIDGEAVDLRPGTLAVIGRGRVHRVLTATGFHGAAVRFGEELLLPASGGRTNPSWLIGTTATHSVDVPDGEISRLEGLLSTLADEQQRPPDARSLDLQRHFLSALLLWVGRWYEDGQQERQASDRAVLDLYRRFIDVLEQDFVRHHDAVHYADALAIPQSALSKALVQATGRTTKEHITERRLLEAARLLRFTELSVGEIAYRAGYSSTSPVLSAGGTAPHPPTTAAGPAIPV